MSHDSLTISLHPQDQTLDRRDYSKWTLRSDQQGTNASIALQTPGMSLKPKLWAYIVEGLHHKDRCKTLQHMDSSKSSCGSVILLSCCDRSQSKLQSQRVEIAPRDTFSDLPRLAGLLRADRAQSGEQLWLR